MTDGIELGQEAEQKDREFALQQMRERIAQSHRPPDGAIAGICIDCEEPIEPARLAALTGKTSRCASCAHDHEQRSRGYRPRIGP